MRARFQHTLTNEARCVRAPPDSVPSSGTSSTTGAALLGVVRDCARTARGRASAGLVLPVLQVYGIGWPDGKASFVIFISMTATTGWVTAGDDGDAMGDTTTGAGAGFRAPGRQRRFGGGGCMVSAPPQATVTGSAAGFWPPGRQTTGEASAPQGNDNGDGR